MFLISVSEPYNSQMDCNNSNLTGQVDILDVALKTLVANFKISRPIPKLMPRPGLKGDSGSQGSTQIG